MQRELYQPILLSIIFIIFTFAGCTQKIERRGIVVDRDTNEPLKDVAIEIYMKHQRGDSLKEKVSTDKNGHFYIGEKRDKDLLFELSKSGYISFVSSLSDENDTIELEKENNRRH